MHNHDNFDNFIISPLEKNNMTDDMFFNTNGVMSPQFNNIDSMDFDDISFLSTIIDDNFTDLERKNTTKMAPAPLRIPEIRKTRVVEVPTLCVAPPPSCGVESLGQPSGKQVTKCTSKKNRDFRLNEAEGLWNARKMLNAYAAYDVNIQLRTRTEAPVNFVPEIMYSSIQYVFLIHLNVSDAVNNYAMVDHPFFARVYLHNAATGARLTRDLNGRAPVRGDFEGAVSRKLDGNFKGELKVKFGDLSYNKNPKMYKMVVVLYDPKDLNHSLIEMESDEFRIYARKPNKKKKKRRKKKAPPKKKKKKMNNNNSKKRKRDDDDYVDDNPRVKKKRKFDVFKNKLDEMIDMFGKLDGEDKTTALEMLVDVVGDKDTF